MATHHNDDMRRGMGQIHQIGRSTSKNTPRGAGDTVGTHAQMGTMGATRAGNRSGNLGARSGSHDIPRPEHHR